MINTFAVNENNDLYVGADGNLAIISGIQAVLQICEQAAKTLLGEAILQTNIGLPNFQTVWIGVPNIPQFEAALITALRAVNGVTDVQDLNTTITNNTLNYSVTIVTIYGQGALSGSI